MADAISEQRSQAAWMCHFMTVALKMYLQTMNFQASFVIYVHILLLSSSKELLIVQQLHVSNSLFHLHIMLTVTTNQFYEQQQIAQRCGRFFGLILIYALSKLDQQLSPQLPRVRVETGTQPV